MIEGDRVQIVIADGVPHEHHAFDGCEGVLKQIGWNGSGRIGKVLVRNAGKRSCTHYFALEALRPLEARRKGDVDVDEGA